MNSKKKVISIKTTTFFDKDLKRLSKKYHSLFSDVDLFMSSLQENPEQGTDLGQGFRKIRLAIASKGKGKSGGARIITYTLTLTEEPRKASKSPSSPSTTNPKKPTSPAKNSLPSSPPPAYKIRPYPSISPPKTLLLRQ